MKHIHGVKKWGIVAFSLCLIVFASAYVYHSRTTIQTDSVCYGQLTQSLEAARSNEKVIVPDFVLSQLMHIKCVATPGFVQFELEGKDAAGITFRIYEMVGGRAASGGDSIFNYCYEQDGVLRSGIRITGRAGTFSTPRCTYDTTFTGTETYMFDR